MGFDEEWGRLRAEAAERAGEPDRPVAKADPVAVARAAVLDRLADFRAGVVLVP
ncbi:hypothetical protein [Streptomyces sp. NPDC048269]|uniref:hypothetical protein n=1 Tax=Streptomyces sp. NPDC048269 TaxID=3155753 RepID=UPI00342E30DB